MKRLLLEGATEGAHALDGPRFHHLAVVQRVRPGEALEVFDGQGQVFDAEVTAVGSTSMTLLLSNQRARPPARRVVIVQGLPKGDKLELVLQKGTELGAAAFLPARAMRSVVKLEGKAEQKLERWRRIVEEAARQCGRADVPEVLAPLALAELELPDTVCLVLDEAVRAVPLSTALQSVDPAKTIALVIGPEGGLERAEVSALAMRGAIPVTLGPLILRTETAALAALAVIRHLDGSLG